MSLRGRSLMAAALAAALFGGQSEINSVPLARLDDGMNFEPDARRFRKPTANRPRSAVRAVNRAKNKAAKKARKGKRK
jgi:hypothetical protein